MLLSQIEETSEPRVVTNDRHPIQILDNNCDLLLFPRKQNPEINREDDVFVNNAIVSETH